jgi:hypothetical protein
MYVGIVTFNKLNVLNNLLAQKWPPKVSESALYAELKLWLTLKEIVFLYNVIWNIVLPKLLFKPNPVPLQFHDLILNQKALGLFPSTQTQNNLQWIPFWRNRLPPSSEFLLKMQTIIYFETLLTRPRYSNLHHIMFIHHCEKLKQKP